MNVKQKQNDSFKNLLPYVVLAMVVLVVVFALNMQGSTVNELTTGELMTELQENNVTEIAITPKSDESIYYVEGKLEGYRETESFTARVVGSELDNVLALIEENNIEDYDTNADPGSSPFLYILVNVLPLVLLVVVMYFLFMKLANSNKSSMDFGRSKARLSNENDKKNFKDVAGLKEEKEEVAELIDFLKNPKKFEKLGARIPKGVLLVGPPGTGKTLLAKAIAGEANVPFFFISGSDFVELFVGVGASRVRDMFKEAKRNAPCIIFIDEIDAVGRQRGTGLGGGHDEREQTLNQLLTEMDGFGENEGIIIIAATNRPDVLDPALLRPGRFDRQVTVSLPDANEREAILKVHAKNKILDKSVNLANLSLRTPGFSGADLENLLNEAALLAVRRNKNAITMDEIDEATDRVLLGPAKTTRKITDKEKKLVSLHEAGHAVIGLKLEDAQEVHKITIIPRGMAGGYTMMLPKEEKIAVHTKDELLAQITGLLGGRVSEEMFLNEISTGASDDIKRATKIARSMVTEYGMSDLGPVQYEEKSEGVFLGRDYTKAKNFSDQVALEIDKETRKIIEECYEKAKKIIADNKDLIFKLSDALMKYETITKEQIESIVKYGEIKPVEEAPKEDNNSGEEKTETKKTRKTKSSENEE
ncbi:MAG TPA: ATP-dependent zinc metalloprotease FtsH [Candidatus Onthocola stercorigallinarum]|nr:ATP-dependent zinc metalloprotease FtsH [Candidatus Onthocola stercorigallinarum]